MIQKGHLIIADISGYTAFLTQLELEHARDILDSLIKTLVGQFRPPFVLAKLEGDAILTYIPDSAFLQRQTVLEAIEQIYFSFCFARDNLHRACHCQACTLAGTLDLKFIIHHGQFTIQTYGAVSDLQGADLSVLHRLLKNSMVSTTGVAAYAFFTRASVAAAHLEPFTQAMIAHAETYEHIGEVPGYIHNLTEAWKREQDRRRVFVEPADAWVKVAFDLPVPPALCWHYLNDSQCICQWCSLESVKAENLKWGRLGVGGVRYCAHATAKEPTVETIIDYQPFDYVTVQSTAPNGFVVQTTTRVTPTETGSQVTWYASRPAGPDRLRALAARLLAPLIKIEMVNELHTAETRLRKLINDDVQAGTVTIANS
jgi:hypothetical protein